MTPLHHLLNKSDLPSSGTAEPSGPGFPKLTPGAPFYFRDTEDACPMCAAARVRIASRPDSFCVVYHCRNADCRLSRDVEGRLAAQEHEFSKGIA